MEYDCMKGSIANITFEPSIDQVAYGSTGYNVHAGSSYIVPV